MSLTVVADNTVELPVYNFQDIAACARRFADQFEAGEQGEAIRALVVIQTGDGLTICIWGENTNSPHEMMGLLDAAKMTAFASTIED